MTLDERVHNAAADVRRRLVVVHVPDAESVVRRFHNRRRTRAIVVMSLLLLAVAVPIALTRSSSSTTETFTGPSAPFPEGSVTDGAWASIPKAGAGIDENASLSDLTSTGTAVLAAGSRPANGDWDAAIWRSIDGLRWSAVSHPASVGEVTAIGARDETLLAVGTTGSDVGFSAVFVWKSTDDGRTWSSIADDADLFGAPAPEMGRPFVSSLRWSDTGLWIGSGGASNGYAGIWISSDGTSWTQVLPEENLAGSVNIVETSTGDLLAYWTPYAWSSSDGQVWAPTDVSLPESYILQEIAAGTSLAIGAEPISGGPTPLLRSEDSGRSWQIDSSLLDQYPGAVARTISRHDGLWVIAGFSGEPNRPDAWISTDAVIWHGLPTSLAKSPGGTLQLVAGIENHIIMMGTAPEFDRYYALDTTAFAGATAPPTDSSPSASQTFESCPGSVPRRTIEGTEIGADALPNADDSITDPARATEILSDNIDELRRRYPASVNAEVGPGFGRAWTGDNGGEYRIVSVDDYGIVVHFATETACPTGGDVHAGIGNMPLFFVVDS